MHRILIGTAGWGISRTASSFFAPTGSQLERYASRFRAVEINSSFYRDHEARTYQKWASLTPKDFRFSVKLSQAYTHDRSWRREDLLRTLDGISHLEAKLAVILLQFAPQHEFELDEDAALFAAIRRVYEGPLVCEPRHRTWAKPEAVDCLRSHQVSKVLADPERCPGLQAEPQGIIRYRRLHGSPEIYTSDYSHASLDQLAETLRVERSLFQESWVIFDNTKLGRATHNGLELIHRLEQAGDAVGSGVIQG